VALLSTAFTLPYALVQPVLGIIADVFGKTRLMNASLLVVALAALASAVTTDFSLLVALRVVSGLVAGGIFPVAMALIGDLMPVNQRQVALGRLLAAGLTGSVLGASISGVIADLVSWRAVFALLGLFAVTVAVLAYRAFRGVVVAKPVAFNLTTIAGNFRSVFADPRAKVCFTAVFFEAIFIQGLFPYVALLLLAAGEARATIAGIVIAGFGAGGLVYSVLVTTLVTRYPQRVLMIGGGSLAAAALVVISLQLAWPLQTAIFLLFGFGFYLLHGCIQVHVTDLSATARGTAASLHSFSFFLGQATGPVIYGYGFAHGEGQATMLVGAAVLVTIGLVCSRLLRLRTAAAQS
jgi:predicted MFS family arabinose efflux permease